MVNVTLPIVSDTGEQVISVMQFGVFLVAVGLFVAGAAAGMWTAARLGLHLPTALPLVDEDQAPEDLPAGVQGWHVPVAIAATPFSHRGRHKADAGEFEEITTALHRPDGAR